MKNFIYCAEQLVNDSLYVESFRQFNDVEVLTNYVFAGFIICLSLLTLVACIAFIKNIF